MFWSMEKFFVHKVEGMPEGGTVLDNPDLIGEQLQVALLYYFLISR